VEVVNMDVLLSIAKEYGLFVALVVYVLWENSKRENKYIAIIKTLSEEVKERLTKIETHIRRKDL
jgi:Flp pilus assembly pilin Flp